MADGNGVDSTPSRGDVLANSSPVTPMDGGGDRGSTSPNGPTSPGRFISASLDDFEMLEKLGRGNCGT
eukprot:SAG31_NODE_30444_length_381_cov_0.734043_1_plen_67_part_01